MANMTRNDSASSLHHQESLFTFSVFQPVLGSALQWLPALGSRELDDMVNAFVPGPSSIQDKRAHVAMDFYKYSAQTGENFKMYSVYDYIPPVPSVASCATDSPASSSAMYDSGYGSTFNVSPVVADTGFYTPHVPAATPSSTTSTSSASLSSAAKKAAPSASKSNSQLDFLNHPGMRILTKDGRDVTNSAGRGSKTKEQRDHAHLMRVIKACDACRRKKTRCDPSHKRRTASSSQCQPQPQQPTLSGTRSAKKARTAKRAAAHGAQAPALATTAHNLLDNAALLDTPVVSYDPLSETPDDFWLQYVNFEGPAPFPEEYNFDNIFGSFSSTSVSAHASPSQPLAPLAPASAYPTGLPAVSSQEPRLPYLQPDGLFGTDYVDFNLYSPTSDSVEEEPPVPERFRPRITGHPQRQPGIPHELPLPELGVSLFSTGQRQHSAARASPGGSVLQPTSSTWSPNDVEACGPQYAACSIDSSALPPDRRIGTIYPARTQDSPGKSQPLPFSHEPGAATSISTLHDNRHLPRATQDAVVPPTLPPVRQATALQPRMSSSGHVIPGALLNAVIPPLRKHAVIVTTSGLGESKIPESCYSQAVTARSRHIQIVPQTGSSLNQASNPESLTDLYVSSLTGRGGARGVSRRLQTTPDALIVIGAQFPAHLDGATATPASSPSSKKLTAAGCGRSRLHGHRQEPVVPAGTQSTVVDRRAVSRTDYTRPSPSQGESSSWVAEPNTVGSPTAGTVSKAGLSSDDFKGGYAVALGLVAGAIVSAAMRLASYTGPLPLLLLTLGFCLYSAHLDGYHHKKSNGDTVPGSETHCHCHCAGPTVVLTSKFRGISRYAAGLRCAVV